MLNGSLQDVLAHRCMQLLQLVEAAVLACYILDRTSGLHWPAAAAIAGDSKELQARMTCSYLQQAKQSKKKLQLMAPPDLLPQLCRPLSVVPSRPLLLCVLCLRHLQLLSLFWPPGKKSGCAEILVAELHCSGKAGGCRKLCELVGHRTRAAAAAAAAARRQQLSSPGELHSQLNLSSVSHRHCLNQATCTTWLPRPALDLPPCKSHWHMSTPLLRMCRLGHANPQLLTYLDGTVTLRH